MAEAKSDAGGATPSAGSSSRRKSAVEQVIETLASGFGNAIAWMAESGVLLVIFALIWLAVGVGIVMSQGSVHEAWTTIRGLPLIVQALAWLLFLPVMVGLWIWETSWPLIVRVLLVLGIAGWNLLVLLPRAAQTVKP
jgi:hypothetical protein